MEQNQFPTQPTTIYGPDATNSTRTFLSSVFSYMAMALVISGVMAWWFGTDEGMSTWLRTPGANGLGFHPTGLGYVVMFAPLILVFVMAGMVERLSSTVMLGVFLLYSALTGMSLSSIFIIYQLGSIFSVFFMAAGIFAIMAVAGYTTKTDLTKLGSLLFIGLIGIIIASVINMFIGSSTMDYVVSILGVVIFTGLTAYDMQKLKRMGEQVVNGTETAQKMALMGALSLYLDFINLFLMLLRLFGRRD
ncbi:MAG: Bax inhibitor-1/YccA family protein [Flavobacteriales bacterium]|nr:Bax inhibitor-1/YccA family protein [Flavobacteriales bacterium]MCC6938969.1 Bax inhibitor-1/YccA family protein [Flavobacteriales bacterium]